MLVAHYLLSIQEESWHEYVPIMVLISSHIFILCFVKQLLYWKTSIILIFFTVHSKKSAPEIHYASFCPLYFHKPENVIFFPCQSLHNSFSAVHKHFIQRFTEEHHQWNDSWDFLFSPCSSKVTFDMLMTARLRSSWDFLKYMTVKLDWDLVFSSTFYF